MTLTELVDRVEDSEELEGMGIDEVKGEPVVLVRHKPTALVSQFSLKCLEGMTWDQLEPVLTGKREPRVLQHMTRVCGYFSQLANWNISKLGELEDRHKGNYALSEADAE